VTCALPVATVWQNSRWGKSGAGRRQTYANHLKMVRMSRAEWKMKRTVCPWLLCDPAWMETHSLKFTPVEKEKRKRKANEMKMENFKLAVDFIACIEYSL